MGDNGNVPRQKLAVAVSLFCVVGGALILVATDTINSMFTAMGDTVLRILGTLASAAFNTLRHL
ncbi:MAG: hypothetical protein CXZ00_16625 [Acidobacteria bacterium]|nr:MAG: hypothetical protein CXZ00_16625 [Acidobacteriota bacterium]